MSEWDAAEDFGGAGCGDWADSVVNLYEAASGGNRAADDTIDFQQVKSDGNTDDVDDGIDGTDFVEVHFFDG